MVLFTESPITFQCLPLKAYTWLLNMTYFIARNEFCYQFFLYFRKLPKKRLIFMKQAAKLQEENMSALMLMVTLYIMDTGYVIMKLSY